MHWMTVSQPSASHNPPSMGNKPSVPLTSLSFWMCWLCCAQMSSTAEGRYTVTSLSDWNPEASQRPVPRAGVSASPDGL